MWKLTFDLCFEPILRGLRKLYEMFSDYSLFQPRLDKLDKGLVLLGIVALFLVGMLLLALENWEAQLVVLKWAALGGAGLGIFALCCALLTCRGKQNGGTEKWEKMP